mmetsp:Transcript_21925/g.70847  ORF Transcript_21925/g.70847 Transcript_21925/m.70847 type:complete len:470 (+) Transcript_21925:40-1449(+)
MCLSPLCGTGVRRRRGAQQSCEVCGNNGALMFLAGSTAVLRLVVCHRSLRCRVVLANKLGVFRVEDGHGRRGDVVPFGLEFGREELGELQLEIGPRVRHLHRRILEVERLAEVDIEPGRGVETTIDEVAQKVLPPAAPEVALHLVAHHLREDDAFMAFHRPKVDPVRLLVLGDDVQPSLRVAQVFRLHHTRFNVARDDERDRLWLTDPPPRLHDELEVDILRVEVLHVGPPRGRDVQHVAWLDDGHHPAHVREARPLPEVRLFEVHHRLGVVRVHHRVRVEAFEGLRWVDEEDAAAACNLHLQALVQRVPRRDEAVARAGVEQELVHGPEALLLENLLEPRPVHLSFQILTHRFADVRSHLWLAEVLALRVRLVVPLRELRLEPYPPLLPRRRALRKLREGAPQALRLRLPNVVVRPVHVLPRLDRDEAVHVRETHEAWPILATLTHRRRQVVKAPLPRQPRALVRNVL